jgi:nicotinamidase-related amidase
MPPEAHYLEYGAWGTELVEGLQPEVGDFVLEKKGHSAFGFTPVHRILRNLRVRRCIVTGGATSGCVSDTVREGVGLGYEMAVVSDATYPPASPYLAVLARRGQLRTTQAILAERPTG